MALERDMKFFNDPAESANEDQAEGAELNEASRARS